MGSIAEAEQEAEERFRHKKVNVPPAEWDEFLAEKAREGYRLVTLYDERPYDFTIDVQRGVRRVILEYVGRLFCSDMTCNAQATELDYTTLYRCKGCEKVIYNPLPSGTWVYIRFTPEPDEPLLLAHVFDWNPQSGDLMLHSDFLSSDNKRVVTGKQAQALLNRYQSKWEPLSTGQPVIIVRYHGDRTQAIHDTVVPYFDLPISTLVSAGDNRYLDDSTPALEDRLLLAVRTD